jgi:hypothetical protein
VGTNGVGTVLEFGESAGAGLAAVALYIFGWRRLKPWAHFWTGVPIVVAGIFGSVSVVAANAWMNAPTGALGEVDAVEDLADPLAAVPADDDPGPAVGQRDAHRHVRDLLGQLINHRLGAADQPRSEVELGEVRALDAVRGHTVRHTSSPGGGDMIGHPGALQRTITVEQIRARGGQQQPPVRHLGHQATPPRAPPFMVRQGARPQRVPLHVDAVGADRAVVVEDSVNDEEHK